MRQHGRVDRRVGHARGQVQEARRLPHVAPVLPKDPLRSHQQVGSVRLYWWLFLLLLVEGLTR